ncbi:hypothetical protein QVD17_21291 [Tagetes erecta]|uniref:Uncharacterized protein n=1 Tax=Tagetes erecta TaxID=13708 RepID=A0AAD8NYT0_TARER|nr:hypothetical protein QVD17_21291 [Tagetes erecta]
MSVDVSNILEEACNYWDVVVRVRWRSEHLGVHRLLAFRQSTNSLYLLLSSPLKQTCSVFFLPPKPNQTKPNQTFFILICFALL